MTPVQAIIAKELRSYFVSPVVYVAIAVFLLSFGFLAYTLVDRTSTLALQQMQMGAEAAAQLNLNDLVFRPLTAWTGFLLFLVVVPLLTMRLLAEERKLRTFEFLMTSPIRLNDIVVAKFISVYIILLGLIGSTYIVPLTLTLFNDFEWNPVLVNYLGLALQAGLFIAAGLFASALTENQIISALISFGLLFLLWLLGVAGMTLGDSTSGNILAYLAFGEHFGHFVSGLVDTKDLVYYASGIVLMLFLTHRVLESTRWK
jgi:ABC-2 type transport system permease protein